MRVVGILAVIATAIILGLWALGASQPVESVDVACRKQFASYGYKAVDQCIADLNVKRQAEEYRRRLDRADMNSR